MPGAGAIIGAVVVGAFTGGSGIAILGLGAGFTAGVVGFAGSLALSAISQALTPKPKIPSTADFSIRQRELTSMIRQPITSWRYVYGEAIVSGPLTFYETTNNNKFHHMIIPLAHHEVQAIKAVYFDDEPIYDADLDGSGNVVSGKFANKARIKKHLGASGQLADADLVAEVSAVDANFKGTGVAYIYVRTETDRDLFPGVIPGNIKAWVKGRKLFDPRDAGTRWSPNPSLGIRDYLTDTTIGRRVAPADINDTVGNASANTCEEMVTTISASHNITSVSAANDTLDLDGNRLKLWTGDRVQLTTTGTLPGGLSLATNYFVIHVHEMISESQSPRIQLASSYANALAEVTVDITDAGTGTHTVTKNAEPRYTLNGVVETSRQPSDILEEMRWAMAGFVPVNGPTWSVLAGAYTAPTITLDQGDFRGPISRKGKHSRRDRFNAVKGTFASHLNAGQVTDYPAVTNATYETQDGGNRIFHELDLPFTNRPNTAQRIAKIALERERQEQTFSIRTSMSGFRLQAGDNVGITEPRRSWVNKPFFCETWGFVAENTEEDDSPALFTDFLLRETASTIYDFNSASEEAPVDPALFQSPLDPTSVGSPSGLTLASGTAQLDTRLDGTIFSRIRVSWTAPADEFVVQGGRIEIQYKKSADATWLPHRFVEATQTEDFILDVKDGTAYDVRIRSINQLGIRASTWITAVGHTVVGKTAPPANVSASGFSAQQNGDVVVFSWGQVADVDLAGYEIRFTPQGSFAWDDATPLTRVTRGTQITTAAVPPGSHTFGIKARDTSGNFSAAAATVNLVVSNTKDIVVQPEQAPRWLGTLTGFVRHHTGKLVPDSQNLASAGGWNTFDKFVANPVASAIYEAPAIDLGFDADQVRVWADIQSVLGPGETTGIAAPALEIDFRDDAGAYDGFEPWTVGTADFRHLKARIVVTTADGLPVVTGFKPVADVAERTERGENITVAVGGSTLSFTRRFHSVPNVQVTPDATAALIPVKKNVTTTGFTAQLFNAAGTDVGGTADWQATGA